MKQLGAALSFMGMAFGCVGAPAPAESEARLYRRCSTRDVRPAEANDVENKVDAFITELAVESAPRTTTRACTSSRSSRTRAWCAPGTSSAPARNFAPLAPFFYLRGA